MTYGDVSRMSRREVNAEVIHLSREQEEYAEEVARLKKENKRIGDILNNISKWVDCIKKDDADWYLKVHEIHKLLLRTVNE